MPPFLISLYVTGVGLFAAFVVWWIFVQGRSFTFFGLGFGEKTITPEEQAYRLPVVRGLLIFSAFSAVFTVGAWMQNTLEPTPAPTTTMTSPPEYIESTPTFAQIPVPTAWRFVGTIITTDPSHLCVLTASEFQESGREAASRLQFNVLDEQGYCSWIVPLNGYNAASKQQVTFWVKGEKGGEKYKVGIKDDITPSGQEPKVSQVASASWIKVSIPLDKFKTKGHNLDSLENFSLNFTEGSGTIYVNQLFFIP